MADKKISDFALEASPTSPHALVLDDPSGTPSTKRLDLDARYAPGLGVREGAAIQSWYVPQQASSSPSSNAASLGNEIMSLHPFVVTDDVTVTAIAAEITTAGSSGATVRYGIYDDSDPYDMTTVTLLADFGTAAADSTGLKTVTGSQALTPGVYWLALAVQAAAATAPLLRGWFDSLRIPGVAASNSTSVTTASGSVNSSVGSGALPTNPAGQTYSRRSTAMMITVGAA